MDEEHLARLITPRTRAIIAVHYAGIGCEMDTILDVAARHGLSVVEDNAHGLLGRYRSRPLGTFGVLASQSFHETKNFSCGEGGALVINEPRLVERAEILREKGTNRNRFFRGQVDKYTWVDSAPATPLRLLAAVCWPNLRPPNSSSTRRQLWHAYAEDCGLGGNRRRASTDRPAARTAYHLFYLLLRSLDERQAFIAHLRDRSVHASFTICPCIYPRWSAARRPARRRGESATSPRTPAAVLQSDRRRPGTRHRAHPVVQGDNAMSQRLLRLPRRPASRLTSPLCSPWRSSFLVPNVTACSRLWSNN